MRINVAILSQNMRTVDIENGGTALDAIRAAGLDANRVSEVKRNGSVISQGTTLSDGETILLVEGKVKGGNPEATTGGVVNATVNVEYVDADSTTGAITFEAGTNIFDMVRAGGHDLNQLAYVKNAAGEKVNLDSLIEDGATYTIYLYE